MTDLLWMIRASILLLFITACAIILGLVVYGVIEFVKWLKGDKHE